MNKAKRGLELAGGIVSIVVGSISALIYLISIVLIDQMMELVYQMFPEYSSLEGIESVFVIVLFIFMLISVAVIVLGATMCPKCIHNGIPKAKLGRSISLCIVLFVDLFIHIDQFLFLLGYGSAMVLLIVGLCLKHDKSTFVYPKLNSTSPEGVATGLTDSNEPEVVEQDQPVEEIKEENSDKNEENVAKLVDDNVDDVESQLLKLKNLKEQGIIEEEQYKEAVRKILSKL